MNKLPELGYFDKKIHDLRHKDYFAMMNTSEQQLVDHQSHLD